MPPQLTYEERQQQVQQRYSQRRRHLQVQLLEQQTVEEEIQRMQGDEIPEGETELRIGQPPLDTDRIAAIGISVGSLQEKTIWVGGFSLCWVNRICAPHVSSYVCLFGGNFYPELLALKSALDACPPNESLAIITQSAQLITFVNNAKHKGKRKALTEQLEKDIRAMIDARSAPVHAVENKSEWGKIIQKYASRLAIGARRLREDEDPKLPPEQQAALDTMLQQKQAINQSLPSQPAGMQPLSQAASAPQQQASSNGSAETPTASVPQAPAVSQSASHQQLPAVPVRDIEAQQKPATSSSRAQSTPGHCSSKPLQPPPRNPAAFQRPVFNPHFVPRHPFGPGFAPPPFPVMPPPPRMTPPQTFQPMFPYASQRRVSPPPSVRATSRAGSSQPSVPISRSDLHPAVTPVRESATDLSGNRQAQAATGVGSNSPGGDTPWIFPKPQDIPSSPSQVMTANGPATTTIDNIAKRFGETRLKRKRGKDEQGESGDVAKKIKAIIASDDDDDFYDAEEYHGQSQSQSQGRWSRWLGGIVEKFL